MDHCGACDQLCERAHAKAVCEGGACRIDECAYLWDDCDGEDPNGCETSLETVTDCGACSSPCQSPNATGDCTGGECTIGDCNPGYWDVDGSDTNGCECLDLSDTVDTCGVSEDVGIISASASLAQRSGLIAHREGYREDRDCYLVTYDSPNPGAGTFRVRFQPDPGNLKFDVWRNDCMTTECIDSMVFETVCLSEGGACETGNGSVFFVCVHAAPGEDLLCQDYGIEFLWE
jgi:hypothetical protein